MQSRDGRAADRAARPASFSLTLFLDEQGAAYSFCGTVTPYVQLLLYASPIALSCALL